MPQLLERINFPKVVTILAITFGVALGACGLTGTGIAASRGGTEILVSLAFIELAVVLLSAVGLVLTVVVWIIASALGKTGHRGSAPQSPFDDKDNKR
jgi:hypothetical protein